MRHKTFVAATLVGALVVMFALPLFNYTIDLWRVLQKDYRHAYTKITPHKHFLKTSYLSEHPQKYDILLFGSSRNAAIVESDIDPKAYNAYADFAILHHHLVSLKKILAAGARPKEVWIGINDFDIWKDPKDFYKDYSKSIYPQSLKEWFDFYRLYFFKPLLPNDIEILKGEEKLVPSNRILRQNLKEHKKTLIERENKLRAAGEEWRKKLTAKAPTLLGYKDTTYRIEATIEEIKEIVRLSKRYGFKVKFFFYPVFYKTYIYYNQTKIEEFKRALAAVTPFYDFYRIDSTTLDELKWSDTSHFVYSVGKEIVQKLLEEQDVVTDKNIDAHLLKIVQDHNLLLKKRLPIEYIMRIHPYMKFAGLKKLWSLDELHPNDTHDMKLLHHKSDYKLVSKSADPHFMITPNIPLKSNALFKCTIKSDRSSVFQLFFKPTLDTSFNEKDSIRIRLRKGQNTLQMIVPKRFLQNGIRIDPINHQGTITLKECGFYGL
ncbi:MAG: hypothetical protein GXO16_08440 [Epsilonproteobacteria bacterium]|nr:hypothetical protein [Campylobacterota bacterium]